MTASTKKHLRWHQRLGDGLERSDAYRSGQARVKLPLPQNNGGTIDGVLRGNYLMQHVTQWAWPTASINLSTDTFRLALYTNAATLDANHNRSTQPPEKRLAETMWLAVRS
jgi:hypothetical protein